MDIKVLALFLQTGSDESLEGVSEAVLFKAFSSSQVDHVKLLRIVFTEVTNQIFVNNLISNVD